MNEKKSSRVVASPAPSAFPAEIFRAKSFQCRSFCRTAANFQRKLSHFATMNRWKLFCSHSWSVQWKTWMFSAKLDQKLFPVFSVFSFEARQKFQKQPSEKRRRQTKDKWTDIKCDWKIGRSDRKVINCATPEAEKKKGYRKLYMWRPNGNIFKVYHRDGDSSVKRYIGERRRERKIFIDWYESKGARSRRERKEGKFVCTRCFFSSGLRSASTVEGEIYEGETVPVKTQTRKKNERKSSWKSLFSLSLTLVVCLTLPSRLKTKGTRHKINI